MIAELLIAPPIDSGPAAARQALAAQQNDQWTAPRKWTMEGFGPGATLHGYQVKAVNWAITVRRGINAYGTGLGKSLVMLAVALQTLENKTCDQGILLVPVPVLYGMAGEAKKAAPTARVVVVHGSPKERRAALGEARWADIVLFAASALGQKECLAYIRSRPRASLQVDEVHKFKRRGEGQTKTLESLVRGRTVAIGYTATPVPNYDIDFFNIVDIFRPGCLGTLDDFQGRTLVDRVVEGSADLAPLQAIHERARPWVFVKGRHDTDVKDRIRVPDHTERELWVPAAGNYEAMVERAAEIALEKVRKGSGAMIAFVGMMMQYQRMLAISPALMHTTMTSGPQGGPGKEMHGYNGPEPKIDDAVAQILEHIGDKGNAGHPIIVACDFTTGLERVRSRLIDAGVKSSRIAYYTGRQNLRARESVKQRTNDAEISVLLLSTAAGGVGLNLQGNRDKGTAPTAMILLNKPWRKCDLRQVIDRISRQGQRFPTTSTVYQSENTIEDFIHALVAGKAVVGDLIERGQSALRAEAEQSLTGAAQEIRWESLTLENKLKALNIPSRILTRVQALDKPHAGKRLAIYREGIC